MLTIEEHHYKDDGCICEECNKKRDECKKLNEYSRIIHEKNTNKLNTIRIVGLKRGKLKKRCMKWL